MAIWGGVLNYVEEGGGRNANYRAIVERRYRKEGLSAFFTPPKWFARVLMSAPIRDAALVLQRRRAPSASRRRCELAGRAYSSSPRNCVTWLLEQPFFTPASGSSTAASARVHVL